MVAEREIVRGAKVKIFPSEEQAARLDLWRRRCISLWNLLLGMEQAAYDGSKFRPELGWRKIWADVVTENHLAANRKWEEGYTIRVGKRKGEFVPPGIGPVTPHPPAALLRRIAGGRVNGEQPGIFIWDDELLKVMARLKKVELSRWIGDLHSHAAQGVCYDVTEAIRSMLRERKKGAAGQDRGFPRFKKQGYAAGSVLFVNTQAKFEWEKRRTVWAKPSGGRGVHLVESEVMVKISNGIGEIPCGPTGKIPAGSRLCECRAWREGEQWWLSAQFKRKAPEPLPERQAECGVKVAAAAVYTIFDGTSFAQVMSRKPTAREEALFSIDGVHASRKKSKSKGWYKAQAVLAKKHAQRRNIRNDVIHKGSRAIVNKFGKIAIDKMDVQSMMKKDGSKGKRGVRKSMANAAMSEAISKVVYKADETGSVVNQTHVLFASTQICCVCGEIHTNMASGKRFLICSCGNRIQRQENAAVNVAEFGNMKAAE